MVPVPPNFRPHSGQPKNRFRNYSEGSGGGGWPRTQGDLIRVLDMYLRGERTTGEVEEWADAIEGRDDIGYDGPRGDYLKQLVIKLANPLLAEQLTPAIARTWKDSLDE